MPRRSSQQRHHAHAGQLGLMDLVSEKAKMRDGRPEGRSRRRGAATGRSERRSAVCAVSIGSCENEAIRRRFTSNGKNSPDQQKVPRPKKEEVRMARSIAGIAGSGETTWT